MGAFDFISVCAVGYTGLTCVDDIDHCQSATCPNNSTCVHVDGVESFECICNPDFKLDGTNRCVQIHITNM